jgi:hypothetical protein
MAPLHLVTGSGHCVDLIETADVNRSLQRSEVRSECEVAAILFDDWVSGFVLRSAEAAS